MSEAVEILLKADDQASKEFTKVGDNLGAMSATATQVLAGLEETAKDLHAELAALAEQHKAGSLTAEQYAAAQTDVLGLLAQNVAQTRAYNADLQKAASIVNAAKTANERYKEQLAEVERLFKANALASSDYQKLTADLSKKIYESSDAFREQKAELAASSQVAADALKEQQANAQKAASILESAKTATEKYNDELAELNRLHKSGALTTERFTKLEAGLKTKIDQSSDAFRKQQADAAKVKAVLESIKTPIDRYNEELAELTRLQKAGLITSDQFAKAQENIGSKIQTTGNSFKDIGGKAKGATELFGTIANLAGGSQLSGMAGQLAGLTEKTSQFSEVAKQGGAGALAFKGGLIAATAAISFGVGKALGDVIFETKRWADELEAAKNKMLEIDKQMLERQQNKFSDAREDISLIRDPAEREAAIEKETEALKKQMLAEDESVQRANASLEEAIAIKKEGRNWMETPAIMNARIDARKRELEQAEATKKATVEEIAALEKMVSERTKNHEAIRAANAEAEKSEAAKQAEIDKSKSYVELLRQEVEMLKATSEEKQKLNAERNTTDEDEGEALRLLKERDAIIAKQEEEKKLADERKKAADEAIKDAERVAEKEKQEQAKAEADSLKAQEDEAARLKRVNAATTNTATESRLLTRGPSQDKTAEVAANTAKTNDLLAEAAAALGELVTATKEKKGKQPQLEMVT